MSKYVAACDTIIEGKPVAKGAPVSVPSHRLKGYEDAGLIENEVVDKAEKKVDAANAADAAKVDKTKDPKTEK